MTPSIVCTPASTMLAPVVATRHGALMATAVSPTTVPRMSSVVMSVASPEKEWVKRRHSGYSLPVFGEGRVGFLLARCARGPHPAHPEVGEGKGPRRQRCYSDRRSLMRSRVHSNSHLSGSGCTAARTKPRRSIQRMARGLSRSVVAMTSREAGLADHAHRQQSGAVERDRVFARLRGLLHESDHRAVRRKRDPAEADHALVGEDGDRADAERQRLTDDVRQVRSDRRPQTDDWSTPFFSLSRLRE